jgi:hypothetical protein
MTKARDLANAATALNAVTATELGFVDGVTSAIQTQIDTKLATATAASTYVANSLADAKGDLFVASADNTVTRLPVGNSGEQIVADSSTSTGLRYQGHIEAGKNFIINGGMDIWQRGTSSATRYEYTTADRYWMNSASTTFSQESTIVPTGARYSLKALTSASTIVQFRQGIETMNAIRLAGKTVVLSGEYQASSTTVIETKLFYATTVDEGIGGAWTEITPTTGGTVTAVSGSFTQAKSVCAVPSNAKSLMVLINSATVASGVSMYFGNLQLELGSVPTAFSRAGGTIQGELAACQRYYIRLNSGNTGIASTFGMGYAGSTTSARIFIPLPVPMRRTGSNYLTLDYSSIRLQDDNTSYTLGTLSLPNYQDGGNGQVAIATSTGMTQYRPMELDTTNGGYIGFSAEL